MSDVNEGIQFMTGGKEPDPWWIDDTQIMGVGVRLDVLRACAVSCEATTPDQAVKFLNDIYAWVLSGEIIPRASGKPTLTPLNGGKRDGE